MAPDLESAKVKARSLFDTLNMPQNRDGLRILDQDGRSKNWPKSKRGYCKKQKGPVTWKAASTHQAIGTDRKSRTPLLDATVTSQEVRDKTAASKSTVPC